MDSWSRSVTQQDEDKKQRKGSKHRLPVTKEERRILLLGSHTDAKASCGNTILGREVFSESPSTKCLFKRHTGLVLKRSLMVINTPDLLDLALYSEESDVVRCFQLSFPGPHALLLVLKSGTFTNQEREALNLIDITFGAGASEFVIIVFMHEDQTSYGSEYSKTDRQAMESLQQTCRQPPHHLRLKNDPSQVQSLLERIETMVDDNVGRYLRFPEESGVPGKTDVDCQTAKSVGGCQKSSSDVRIVLIGKTGVGKSATGNTVLGRRVFQSQATMFSVTKQCQRERGEMCGRTVTVVDTPGLFDTSFSNEEIQQEMMRCIELSAPGPHVFLLLITIGRFTQEERETLQLIQTTFGQKAQSYTIVFFTRGDNLRDTSIDEYIKNGDPDVQTLIRDCGKRYHVFNNRDEKSDQVKSLLKKIDKMVKNNKGTFYSNEMFQEAERALKHIQVYKNKEEKVKQQMKNIKANYEAEIQEYKEKLHKEKARGKIRELLLMFRDSGQSKNHQTEAEDMVPPEQLQYETQLEKNEKQKNPVSATTDIDTEEESAQGAKGGESDQRKKTNKKASRSRSLVNITLTKKYRKQAEMFQKGHKGNETAGREEIQGGRKRSVSSSLERPVMSPKDQTGSKIKQENIDVPQISVELIEAIREIEEHTKSEKLREIEKLMKKMEEDIKMYRETAEKLCEEYKKYQEKKIIKLRCVIQ